MVGGLAPPPAEREEVAASSSKQGVIFILEAANLEVAKVGKVGKTLSPMSSAAELCDKCAQGRPPGHACCLFDHAQIMWPAGACMLSPHFDKPAFPSFSLINY